MVKDRPDWCISRQRVWGVPIVAFYCAACGDILLDQKVINHVADIFEREGADAWFAHEAAELVPPGTTCAKCAGCAFRKEYNILDVWFDSGSTHLATLGKRPDLPWPADLYIEGGDQYRGWFQSSLLVGVALRGQAPYRESITVGWTLDEQGRAMSKSKGIGIDANDMVRDRGAEIARLLPASMEHTQDLSIGKKLLDQVSEVYKKVRNTCRYMLGNYANQLEPGHPKFNPETDSVPYAEMLELDRWALARTARLVQRCLKGYGDYQFHHVYNALNNFCTVDLSAFYFDVLKDRLYVSAPLSLERRSAQTAMWKILDALVRLLAPILPFTAEEVYAAMQDGIELKDRSVSVHTLLFPKPEVPPDSDLLLAEWDRLLEVRETVLKALEDVRRSGTIGNSLEASVRLRASGDRAALLRRHAAELRYIFIVSETEVAEDPQVEKGAVIVEVSRAPGAKCERCWNYSTLVGESADQPGLCERCGPVVRGLAHAGAVS
jgi:isoleucyl-tRNA synthetase